MSQSSCVWVLWINLIEHFNVYIQGHRTELSAPPRRQTTAKKSHVSCLGSRVEKAHSTIIISSCYHASNEGDIQKWVSWHLRANEVKYFIFNKSFLVQPGGKWTVFSGASEYWRVSDVFPRRVLVFPLLYGACADAIILLALVKKHSLYYIYISLAFSFPVLTLMVPASPVF